MARPERSLAKINPPKLSGILPRKRLFNLLDEACNHPLVWVSAQPGAGKTALIASYLETRKLSNIWYHVDAGDLDPATFFHFLALTLPTSAKRGRKYKPLTPLTPEYLPDLAGFVRRWFREFFTQLPKRCVLVLDNYQDVDAHAPIHAIMRDAIDEVPDGINIIVLSRMLAPAEFARTFASRRAGTIDREDLLLTLEETSKIASTDQTLADDDLRLLYDQSNGWAAGVVLMLERLRRTGKVNRIGSGESMETIFNYFVDLVFKQIPDGDQAMLLKLAYLPSMTVLCAEQLTDNPGVGKLLEGLFQRRLFTDRRGDLQPVYHFHSLFRAFLLREAELAIPQDEKVILFRRAAQLLSEQGDVGEAFALASRAQDWIGSLGLIFSNAPALLKQGRWLTVEDWISKVPEPARKATPWTAYWLGLCRLAVSPIESRTRFEEAFNGFVKDADLLGQALSASGVADSIFYEYASFVPGDKWIDILSELLTKEIKWPSVEIEYRILSSLLILLAFRQPRHVLFEPCITRLLALNEEDIDPTLKVFAGTYLLSCYAWQGDDSRAQRLIAQMQPITERLDVAPLFQVVWQIGVCCTNNLGGAPSAALDAIRLAVKIVDAHGLIILRERVLMYHIYAALTCGDINLADSLIKDISDLQQPSLRVNAALLIYLSGWLAMLRGDARLALDTIEEGFASQTPADAGVHNFMTHGLILFAMAANENHLHHQALAHIAHARREYPGTEGPFFEFSFLLCEADAKLGLGADEDGSDLLRTAFRMGRAHSFRTNAVWIPSMMVRLCEKALVLDIEPTYVRNLIRARSLTPRRDWVEGWPWRIKITTLGRFEILQDDTPYAPVLKPQRKVLDLLKALIALGGRDVNTNTLIETLWPDLDGDAAQNNFKGCLHRLRKLLGHEAAILLQDGNLSINAVLCRVDIWAIDDLMEQISNCTPDTPRNELIEFSERLLQNYRSHFLMDETTVPHVLATQDKMRSKFRRTVIKLGTLLEANDAWDQAIEIYQRALELDNLSESIYQRLILCFKKHGNDAEALNVYRRCRDMLSIVLGVSPSKETQALLAAR